MYHGAMRYCIDHSSQHEVRCFPVYSFRVSNDGAGRSILFPWIILDLFVGEICKGALWNILMHCNADRAVIKLGTPSTTVCVVMPERDDDRGILGCIRMQL
jgi:hypothetical protein